MSTKEELKARLTRLQQLQHFCLKSEAAPRINAMLSLAQSEPGIPVLPADLDSDPWSFNCVNGTVELRTGRLREHRREDRITKLCPVAFRPEAACAAWVRFLGAVFEGDGGLVAFVQRLLGRCLSGDVSEQILPIFWGGGANGKSTLVNAVLETMGPDYSMKAPAELLMQSKGDRHPCELAQLFGMRLVVASEAHQGRRLNEALVKARRMQENFWQFNPTHKIIFLTNHKPVVVGTDAGIWRRLRLVPFGVRFWDPFEAANEGKDLPGALRQDKHLSEKLQAEAEGILAWMVRGCLDWQRDGLTLPEKVRTATAGYRQSEDVLARFIAECCVTGTEHRCRSGKLYDAYKRWAEANGEEPLSGRRFGEAMSERDYARYTSNGTWYRGIALLGGGAADGDDPWESGRG
jgi:putative DNA primase/helicase